VDLDARKRGQLELVTQARAFAIGQLGLPDGRSFREYADLGRPYPLWNVGHARILAAAAVVVLPVTGCVAYRAIFTKRTRSLRRAGCDATVTMPASAVCRLLTLGHLRDPVLARCSWPESRLVSTMFHEMAHEQLTCAATAFNEAYATVIAQEGCGNGC
jgi:predicted aminopeptidase